MNRLLPLICLLFVKAVALAVPAAPDKITITQRDGSPVTIELHGDEHFSYYTTADGYTLIQSPELDYYYATVRNGHIAATNILAHDVNFRTANENQFLSTTPKHLLGQADRAEAQRKRIQAADQHRSSALKVPTMSNFRGIVLLVNFTDTVFTTPKEIFQEMTNLRNYRGYGTTGRGVYTGSVRDYFYDNSHGIFDPQFDVVGPIQVNFKATDGKSSSLFIFREAVRKAVDSLNIDFTRYDANRDGMVDMLYFITAGPSSAFLGNDPNLLWPHKHHIGGRGYAFYEYRGYKFDVYACSTEKEGYSNYRRNDLYIAGIGTMCHEFGHVLGLPDLYDTDGSVNGNGSAPTFWDIMAGGSHRNYGRTPVGYSAYDSYAAGFSTPEVISEHGYYSLPSFESTGQSYRINSRTPGEYFLLENRQKENGKWDRYLDYSGMLVARVDSTPDRAARWIWNQVNNVENDECYVVLKAFNHYYPMFDPFPGAGNVTKLTSNIEDFANLRNHLGFPSEFSLENISMTDGIVSFLVPGADNITKAFESFENTDEDATANTKANRIGDSFTWTFSPEVTVVTPQSTAEGAGKRTLNLKPGGWAQTMEGVSGDYTSATLDVFNTSSVDASIQIYIAPVSERTHLARSSVVEPAWTLVSSDMNVVNQGTKRTLTWDINSSGSLLFKVVNTSGGSENEGIYADNFTVHYTPMSIPSGLSETVDEKNLRVAHTDTGISISSTDMTTPIYVYSLGGQCIAMGQGDISLPSRGFYIVSQGSTSVKVIF